MLIFKKDLKNNTKIIISKKWPPFCHGKKKGQNSLPFRI